MRCAILALVFITGLFAQRSHAKRYGAQPGSFDHYLLALSWSPDYCLQYPLASQCSKHFGFVVHGFWPELANGSGVEDCSSAPGLPDPTVMLDIMPDVSLVQHEWQTHGTCSGLTPQAYFALLRQAFNSVKIPNAFVRPTEPAVLAPAIIKQDFDQANTNLNAGEIVIVCPNNYLSQVEICMSKSLAPVACPAATHDCRARTVTVTPVH